VPIRLWTLSIVLSFHLQSIFLPGSDLVVRLKNGKWHSASDLFTWNPRVMEDSTITHCAVPVHE